MKIGYIHKVAITLTGVYLIFLRSWLIFTPEIINCMFLHLHSANLVHRSVIDMYIYTFYLLCDLHTNSPRLATCRAHSIISGARADLTWRLWVQVYQGQNTPFLPHVVQISFSWANANWGLWVKPTRSWKVISSFYPCQAFSYGLVEIWNNFQLDMYHFPLPALYS